MNNSKLWYKIVMQNGRIRAHNLIQNELWHSSRPYYIRFASIHCWIRDNIGRMHLGHVRQIGYHKHAIDMVHRSCLITTIICTISIKMNTLSLHGVTNKGIFHSRKTTTMCWTNPRTSNHPYWLTAEQWKSCTTQTPDTTLMDSH
jgi:hypothetical protein